MSACAEAITGQIDQDATEIKKTLSINRWYVRNAGAKGFGPLASLEPRRVMHIVQEGKEQKWQLLPWCSESDIEGQ